MVVLHLPLGVAVVGVHLVVELLHLAPDLVQGLVHLPAPAVHLQPQGRGHVADGLDGGVDVVVHVVPGDDVRLRVELRLRLVAQLRDVLRELVAPLVRLLQALGDVLHPRVVRLQRLLHVAHVQAHGGDLRGHGGLHALPGRDDGVRGVHARPHLVEVHVHRVHGGGEVLHVALASQDDSLHVGSVVLLAAKKVLELAHIILHCIEIVDVALEAWGAAAVPAAPALLGAEEGDALLHVLGHDLQLARDLCLEVCHPVGHLLQQLRVASLASQPRLACDVIHLPSARG
mmetsp:Transcript_2323/g.6840  ORF Transcript_2323/g.6840 Transcript_2323/m.6840 type:complete len:287 (-) Transcript_2323:501-1361(-)